MPQQEVARKAVKVKTPKQYIPSDEWTILMILKEEKELARSYRYDGEASENNMYDQ